MSISCCHFNLSLKNPFFHWKYVSCLPKLCATFILMSRSSYEHVGVLLPHVFPHFLFSYIQLIRSILFTLKRIPFYEITFNNNVWKKGNH